MTSIESGLKLPQLGMLLRDDLGPGLLGRRWSVRLMDQAPRQNVFARVAEVVHVQDEVTEACCETVEQLGGRVLPRGIAGVIATQWIDDFHFAAVSDLVPEARNLTSIRSDPTFRPATEQQFWWIAAALFRALAQLHRHGLRHGGLSPESVYVVGDMLVIGDLWWTMTEPDQSPRNRFHRCALPRTVLRFAAPEIRDGADPSGESDLYSLGAILKFLLPEAAAAAIEKGDARTEVESFLAALLRGDPNSRATSPWIETLINERLLRDVDCPFPASWKFELNSDFRLGLQPLPAGRVIDICDIYRHMGSIQVGCRAEELETWYTVIGLLRSCGRTYAALSDPPDRTDRCEAEPLKAVCLENDWQFRVLPQSEFESIREDLADNVRRGTGSDQRYAEFLLGPLRDWEPSPNPPPGPREDRCGFAHRNQLVR